MQRIQALGLLIAIVLVTGCSQQSELGKPLTVGQYLHDVDLAREVVKKAKNNPAKYENDPAYINAAKAISKLQFGGSLNDCWIDRKISTVNANSACIDTWLKKFGYE